MATQAVSLEDGPDLLVVTDVIRRCRLLPCRRGPVRDEHQAGQGYQRTDYVKLFEHGRNPVRKGNEPASELGRSVTFNSAASLCYSIEAALGG